jgi:5'-nucleotidase
MSALLVLTGCQTAPQQAEDEGAAAPEEQQAEAYQLTVLHSSDGESSLLGDDETGSVAQFATVIDRLRSEAGAEQTLVVSSGDNYLAGLQYQASRGEYDARALNMMGYDFSAIGNHEFDFGPDGFARFVENAEFEFVSSNLDFSDEPALSEYQGEKIFETRVVERGGRQIGIVGGVYEDLATISSPGDNITIENVENELRKAVAELENQGVNIIISLTHLQSVEEEKQLAKWISGIDIYVAGGGDNLLGGPDDEYLMRENDEGEMVPDEPQGPYPHRVTTPNGNPALVVSTDGAYDYVGRLTVSFDSNGVISSVNEEKSGPVPVKPDLPADQEIQSEIVEPVEQEIASFEEQVVGRTETALDGTREKVRTQETTMGNAITDAYVAVAQERYDGDVDFAFTNGGGIRNSVVIQAGGEITLYDVTNILPFPNFLTVMEDFTAQELKQMFEHAVAALPEADGRYLQVSGIQVVYDSSAAAGNRVQEITVGNTTVVANGEVQTEETFNGVTNSFTAGGGDGFSTLANFGPDRTTNVGASYTEAFRVYIRNNSPLNVSIEGRLQDLAS